MSLLFRPPPLAHFPLPPHLAPLSRATGKKKKKKESLASFNMTKACNMLFGKGRVRTQDLGYLALTPSGLAQPNPARPGPATGTCGLRTGERGGRGGQDGGKGGARAGQPAPQHFHVRAGRPELVREVRLRAARAVSVH